MNYKLNQLLFWQVARKSNPKEEPTAAVEKKANALKDKLRQLETERVAIFAELRELYGSSWTWDYLDGDVHALQGYESYPDALSNESFTPSELAELNSNGILSDIQHAAVTHSRNSFHLPLHADRIVTRRELSTILGWSNDKFTARINRQFNPLPVLIKGENGQSEQYSCMMVYRWLLREDYERRSTDSPIVDDWKDAIRFGDIKDGWISGQNPGKIQLHEYKTARPDLFADAA